MAFRSDPTEPDVHMPLGDHLDELRRRLFFALLGMIPIAIVAFYFGTDLLEFVVEPVREALRGGWQPAVLQATSPFETFGTYIKVSTIATLLVGSPWVLYQLWAFVAPGLYAHERRYVYFLLPLSSVLTITGVIFLFRVILPLILSFAVAFGSGLGAKVAMPQPPPEGTVFGTVPVLDADPPNPEVGWEWINRTLAAKRVCVAIEAGVPVILTQDLHREAGVLQQYRVSETISLLLSLTLAFAGAFQMPVAVLLLGWAGIINVAMLRKYRKHALLICAVVSAALTPGDPTPMIAMLVPLYGLYELGVLLLQWFPAGRLARRKAPVGGPADGLPADGLPADGGPADGVNRVETDDETP